MLEPKLKVALDYQKCHAEKCGEGTCAALLECPLNLWRQEGSYDLPYVIPGFCQDCGIYVEACPLNAIRML